MCCQYSGHYIQRDNILRWSNDPLGKVQVVHWTRTPVGTPDVFLAGPDELLFQITVLVRLTVRTEMPLFDRKQYEEATSRSVFQSLQACGETLVTNVSNS